MTTASTITAMPDGALLSPVPPPVPLPLQPNSAFSFCCSLRIISSRSGGPPCVFRRPPQGSLSCDPPGSFQAIRNSVFHERKVKSKVALYVRRYLSASGYPLLTACNG